METERSGWRGWFQSRFVLGWARRAYLVLASLSLLVVLAALGVALFFELATMTPTPQEPVPPPYSPQPVTIDASAIFQSLKPPGNIRFVVTEPYIDQIMAVDEPFGYFDADTQNGLSPFPNDFDIVGGDDAAMFDRVPMPVSAGGVQVQRAGLRATAQLRNEIAAAIGGKRTGRSYSILVVARDRFGHVSHPAKVVFSLAFGPPPPESQTPEALVPAKLNELGQVARAIALHLDPSKTTVYFDVFNRAMRVPAQCGMADDNSSFVQNFGSSFYQLKKQITRQNVDAFYAGVCRAWRQALADEAARQQAADAARDTAIQRNLAARDASETAKFVAYVKRSTALYVAASAGIAFLFISLFLAFLAIENHSDALRQAVQAIADRKKD